MSSSSAGILPVDCPPDSSSIVVRSREIIAARPDKSVQAPNELLHLARNLESDGRQCLRPHSPITVPGIDAGAGHFLALLVGLKQSLAAVGQTDYKLAMAARLAFGEDLADDGVDGSNLSCDLADVGVTTNRPHEVLDVGHEKSSLVFQINLQYVSFFFRRSQPRIAHLQVISPVVVLRHAVSIRRSREVFAGT